MVIINCRVRIDVLSDISSFVGGGVEEVVEDIG